MTKLWGQFLKRYLNHQSQNELDNYLSKVSFQFPSGQWVYSQRKLIVISDFEINIVVADCQTLPGAIGCFKKWFFFNCTVPNFYTWGMTPKEHMKNMKPFGTCLTHPPPPARSKISRFSTGVFLKWKNQNHCMHLKLGSNCRYCWDKQLL